MGVKIILKNHLQKKYVNTFTVDIQYLRYRHLNTEKISMIYTKVKINFRVFRRARKEDN